MNMSKYLKNINLCLFPLSGFNCFSTEIEPMFKGFTEGNFKEILKTQGTNSIYDGVFDHFIDKNGNLTENGNALHSKLAEKMTEIFDENGKKDPKIKDVPLKHLIQASVIGMPKDSQVPKGHIDIDGTTVYYQKYGEDGAAPLVVWLHGNGSSYDDWNWGELKEPPILPNVLAIEYPNYVKNTYSTFEDIDKYTTAVAKFLEKYIREHYPENENPNKGVILFSHSFGGNVNTLIYSKLKDKIPYIKLKAILVFPYYNAIDASKNVITNCSKLGVKSSESKGNLLDKLFPADFPDGAPGIGKKDDIIENLVLEIYKRMFENNKKNDTQNEFEYIESVSNNAIILSRCGVTLKDLKLVSSAKGHCEWDYNLRVSAVATLKQILTDIKYFVFKYGENEEREANIILIYSANDLIVGPGGWKIANFFVKKHVGQDDKELYKDNCKYLKLAYEFIGHPISQNDIDFIKKLNINKNFNQAMSDIIGKQAMCGSCKQIMNEEKKGNKDVTGIEY